MHVYCNDSKDARTLPLNGGLEAVRGAGGRIVVREFRYGDAASRLALFVPCPGERAREALVILAPDARATIEGFPCLPAQLVSDGEEIVVEGLRMLFGAYEAQPAREYGSEEPPRRCARCASTITVGQVVAPCPRCGALFHHDPTIAIPDDAQLAAGSAPNALDCDHLDDNCPSCGGSRAAMLWTPADKESRDA